MRNTFHKSAYSDETCSKKRCQPDSDEHVPWKEEGAYSDEHLLRKEEDALPTTEKNAFHGKGRVPTVTNI